MHHFIELFRLIRLVVPYGQALVKLAEEIAKSAIPEGSRKINGKYIQSHLLLRLKGIIMLLLDIFCFTLALSIYAVMTVELSISHI